jgi:hypothetical protein
MRFPCPSDCRPDRIKRAVVLEAVKVWPGKAGVRRDVGATANLDSSCARRLVVLTMQPARPESPRLRMCQGEARPLRLRAQCRSERCVTE